MQILPDLNFRNANVDTQGSATAVAICFFAIRATPEAMKDCAETDRNDRDLRYKTSRITTSILGMRQLRHVARAGGTAP